MTVFMVKKYLVRKLGLSNEAEVIFLSLSLIIVIILKDRMRDSDCSFIEMTSSQLRGSTCTK